MSEFRKGTPLRLKRGRHIFSADAFVFAEGFCAAGWTRVRIPLTDYLMLIPTEDLEIWTESQPAETADSVIIGKLDTIITLLNKMAGTVTDLETEIQLLKQTVSDAATRVSTDLANLKAQVAAGASAADLTQQITEIDDSIAGLKAIDPAATTPAPSA